MENNIIGRLFASFTDLERAIESAKQTLAARREVRADILERLQSYDGILAKQRTLANELCAYMENGQWERVARHVTLINGLSAMIRDDARAILSSLSEPEQAPAEEEQVVC